MNLIDTSGWVEILTGGRHAHLFIQVARQEHRLLVPSLVAAEVVHHVQSYLGDCAALDALAAVTRGTTLPLTMTTAAEAALAAERRGLSLRASLIYAQARAAGARLWTLDETLRDLDGVECSHAYCPSSCRW